MFPTLSPAQKRQVFLLILVAALGYFVDIYDLLLFGMVRVPSLVSLGVPPDQILAQGAYLQNMQMGGLLLGGILWGILGDKRGRLSVLFGSIILYSAANLLNGLAATVDQYALWRLLAGVGLAGELGAGITLVAEVMPRESRGWGTSIVATVGILGAVVGYGVADLTTWRHAYFIGGGLGVLLLLLRVGVSESGLFKKALGSTAASARGDFFMLFTDRGRLSKYLRVIAIGLPLWYLVGILIIFSPEIGRSFGLPTPPKAGPAVALCYIGLAAGDLFSGMVSQWLRSRVKAVALFMLAQALGVALYFTLGRTSLEAFYACCVLLGLAGGYWALFVTIGAEQFGTNIRSTVATTVPNMVRGATVPMTLAFVWLQRRALGSAASALAVGAVVFGLAVWGLVGLEESFHKDLDYVEPV